MTPEEISDQERWFAEMRELTAANTRAIQALAVDLHTLSTQSMGLSADIRETRAIADSNARVIQALCQLAAEDREERQAIINQSNAMLADIRGLQAENRRILDILLNQQQRDQE